MNVRWSSLFSSTSKNTDYKIVRWVRFETLFFNPKIAHSRILTIDVFLEFVYTKYKDKIPYGIKFSKTKFTDNHELQLGEGEHGLTCATFVYSILLANGLQLVDLSTWKKRAQDEDWKNLIVSFLKKSIKDSNHIENIEREEINFRLKPEEIAAASSIPLPELPANFGYCSNWGQKFNELS